MNSPVARHGLRTLRSACARLVVVLSDEPDAEWLTAYQPDEVLIEPLVRASYLAGVRCALLSEAKTNPTPAHPTVLSGAHVLSPIGGLEHILEEAKHSKADLYAPYWHNTHVDTRTLADALPSRVPYLDMAVLSPELLAGSGFLEFWNGFTGSDHWADFWHGLAPFMQVLEKNGYSVAYPLEVDDLQTGDPRLYEIDTAIEKGSGALPLALFTLDPLLHDLNAINLRNALKFLRDRDPELHRAAIRYAAQNVRMREFNAIADQIVVLPFAATNPEKQAWSFGTVAVFIHAYYPEMIADLSARAATIPGPYHLFVTTASEENKTAIEEYLVSDGASPEEFEVRVVEQNRGRDMSSLFITFRDVILSDKYEVALRLHSKRTPQVSPRVAGEFKEHLFENLVPTPGYVSNLLDLMEAEPEIGLLMPPVIHIGFATLGHSWFNNRPVVQSLLNDMDIDVPLDWSTPVAPNGTMYWFRIDAMRKMFEHPWSWDDYNEEPHHVDGGLAHAQERLIGYCVQAAGYRVVSGMNPDSAARNYAKLEYKLQRLASHLPSGNILEQDELLSSRRGRLGARAFYVLRDIYGRTLVRWPAARKPLRPIAKVVQKVLTASFAPGPNKHN